jgi:hypothetical protein
MRQYVKIIGKEVDVEFKDKTMPSKERYMAADEDKISVKVVSKVKKEIIEHSKRNSVQPDKQC